MKHRPLYAALPLLLATALATGASPAVAGERADYAEHVVHCAQGMGFSGAHNPGVHHRGFAGWPGAHEC